MFFDPWGRYHAARLTEVDKMDPCVGTIVIGALSFNIRSIQDTATIAPGKTRIMQVYCPKDKYPIGGGAYVDDPATNYLLRSSFLINNGKDPASWAAVWTNPTEKFDLQVMTFTVQVFCAK